MGQVMESPNIEQQGRQYLPRAYAGKYVCSGGVCYLTDQREVQGIYEPTSFTNYYGWPVGGSSGFPRCTANREAHFCVRHG